MRETIAHRGPDGAGEWISDDRRVGLGHTRLAIQDITSAGFQPMVHPAGPVITFNGEIYNYPALRAELERDGVQFRTRCDTEVILHLYVREGRRCVERLIGMFAFAIWDPHERELFFARDPIGEKPFYYAELGGTLVFGSEIKALLEHPRLTPAVNEAVLEAYFTNLVTTAPATLFAGVQKLPPGFRGSCGRGGVRIERYFELYAPRRLQGPDFATATEAVRAHLDRSVNQRLLSDVPVGVLLSGGLDSTTLVALLHERSHGIATFSVGFEDNPAIDEREPARRAAKQFGTDHHEIVVSEQRAMALLPELIHHQDEPLADPVCMPLHFVCGLAREQGVPVVLAGEGSDELFWGYPAYQRVLSRERWVRAFLKLPRPARRAVARATPAGHPRLRDLAETFASGRPLPMHMPAGFTRAQRLELLRRASGETSPGWSPSAPDADRLDPIDRLALDTQEEEFGLRLPELLLMRIDRFSMAHGVEARVPFLDPALVRYVYHLPVAQKMNATESKRLLRSAVADVVPEWVLARRKQGFAAPVSSWFTSSFGDLMAELAQGEAIRRYFDTAAFERALAAARAGDRRAPALWPVFNFALWHRHWIEGESLQAAVAPAA